MFVPDLQRFKLWLVVPRQEKNSEVRRALFVERAKQQNLLLIDLLEDVLESAIILLQNRILRGQIERPFFVDGYLE